MKTLYCFKCGKEVGRIDKGRILKNIRIYHEDCILDNSKPSNDSDILNFLKGVTNENNNGYR